MQIQTNSSLFSLETWFVGVHCMHMKCHVCEHLPDGMLFALPYVLIMAHCIKERIIMYSISQDIISI